MSTKFKFDASALEVFTNNLAQIPKENAQQRKKFLRKQGSVLRRETARIARSRVNRLAVNRPKYQRVAGQYHKSIKRGRFYEYGTAECIRVYSSDKIAHLIELGWTPVLRNGKHGRQVDGKSVFADAAKKFEPEFNAACLELTNFYESEIVK